MIYVIMCGGNYTKWDEPRQLLHIFGVPIVQRTIMLLGQCGVDPDDIFISTNNKVFEQYAPILSHPNRYEAYGEGNNNGTWTDCFYPTCEPTTYLFGDVVYSLDAIRTIVETKTDNIELFASAPPFSKYYTKPWAEPFALKVMEPSFLRTSISLTNNLAKQGLFRRAPIMWELWQVITCHTLNDIDYNSYTHINDYTCDVDSPEDLEKIVVQIKQKVADMSDMAYDDMWRRRNE